MQRTRHSPSTLGKEDTFQLNEGRKPSEYFHDIHEMNLQEGIELLLKWFEQSSKIKPVLENANRRKTQARRCRNIHPCRKERWPLKDSSRVILPSKIPAEQSHFAVMTPCQLHGQNLQQYLCVLTQRGTLCQTMTTFWKVFMLNEKPPEAIPSSMLLSSSRVQCCLTDCKSLILLDRQSPHSSPRTPARCRPP